MAYSAHRKGRMLPEDEAKLQRCMTFIEKEVEASDLTTSLYSAQILDLNDKSYINSGETRVARVRRLLEMLIMRGPNAFQEFIKSLTKVGYKHLVGELQKNTEPVDIAPGHNYFTADDIGKKTSDDRLVCIEDLLDHLCARVTHLERQEGIPDSPNFPPCEIKTIRDELDGLRNYTLKRIRDVFQENADKDIKIAELSTDLDEKRKQLDHTEARIRELEGRIQELESHCMQYRKEINQLKKDSAFQNHKVTIQARKIEAQSDRLDKQEKQMQLQQDQIDDMKDQNEQWMKTMSNLVARAVDKNNTKTNVRPRHCGKAMKNQKLRW